MRLAAPCEFAQDGHVARLAEDHANARRLAQGLSELPGVALDAASLETNLVYFDIAGTGLDATAFVAAALRQGLRVTGMGMTRLRAVTHPDIDAAAIERALAVFAGCCASAIQAGMPAA